MHQKHLVITSELVNGRARIYDQVCLALKSVLVTTSLHCLHCNTPAVSHPGTYWHWRVGAFLCNVECLAAYFTSAITISPIYGTTQNFSQHTLFLGLQGDPGWEPFCKVTLRIACLFLAKLVRRLKGTKEKGTDNFLLLLLLYTNLFNLT